MFGTKILNARQLCECLGISTTLLYRLLKNGLPAHKLSGTSRRYYNLDEVKAWLTKAGYHEESKWTN